MHQQQFSQHVNAEIREHKFIAPKDTSEVAAADMESSVKALVDCKLHIYVSSKD